MAGRRGFSFSRCRGFFNVNHACMCTPGLRFRSGPGCTTTSQTDPPSAKVAPVAVPVGCQLATMTLAVKTVTPPKGGLHGRSCHPFLDGQCIWAEWLHETGRLSATLAVNRLGRRRATRPWTPPKDK